MKQLILTKFPWPWLPTAALLIFFVFFVGLFIVTHIRSKTSLYQHASLLPLEEGSQTQESQHVG